MVLLMDMMDNRNGLFRQRLNHELGRALSFELLAEHDDYNNTGFADDTIAISFGDMLFHVPPVIRTQWKQYFKGIKTEKEDIYHTIHDNHLDRLLFSDFQTVEESDKAMSFWNARLENLP